MPYISRSSRWRIAGFLLAFFLTEIIDNIPVRSLGGIAFLAIIMTWGLTIRRRIFHREIRGFLMAGAWLLLTLFPLRISRWDIFNWSQQADAFLWYCYYIPITAAPLFSLCAARRVGRAEEKRQYRGERELFVFWLALCALILTNGRHGFLMTISQGRVVRYGFLYYTVVIWSAGLSVGSLVVLTNRCRVSSVRKYWFIPVLAAVPGTALLAVYFAVGGSPSVGPFKLFHVQEAYALLYIGLWESCIQLGMIPANGGYDDIFRLSHLRAALLNRNGEIVYRASDYTAETLGEDLVRKESPVRGGTVVWTEDLTSIHELNRGLKEAREELEEENELIEEENRIRAEKARLEEQNRLYDQIAVTVRPEVELVDACLAADPRDEDGFRTALQRSVLLGAYIKRRADLALLAEGSELLHTDDLYYAVRESLEYLMMTGAVCEVRRDKDSEVSAALLTEAYELFEAVLEKTAFRQGTWLVVLSAAPTFSMTICLDTEEPVMKPDWRAEALEKLGAELSVRVEDETTYLTLREKGGAV